MRNMLSNALTLLWVCFMHLSARLLHTQTSPLACTVAVLNHRHPLCTTVLVIAMVVHQQWVAALLDIDKAMALALVFTFASSR